MLLNEGCRVLIITLFIHESCLGFDKNLVSLAHQRYKTILHPCLNQSKPNKKMLVLDFPYSSEYPV